MSYIQSLFVQKRLSVQLAVLFLIVMFGMSLGASISFLLIRFSGFSVAILKGIQVIQTFFIFIFPAILAAYLFSERVKSFLFLVRCNWKFYLLSVIGILAIVPLVNFLADWNEHQLVFPSFLAPLEEWMRMLENKAKEQTELFLEASSLSGLAINLLVMAILPAFSEELMFRGVLQRLFSNRFGKHAGVWIAAILFSLVHFQFFGFFPRMLLGVLFGYFVCFSGSLWTAVLMHFLNNALAVCSSYFSKKASFPDFDSFGTGSEWWLALLSFCVTGLVVFFLYKKAKDVAAHEQ